MTRGQLAICIADPISRRLVEGIAAQLELEPVLLEGGEINEEGRLDGAELLLADEPVAREFVDRSAQHKLQRRGLHLALVAVTPALSPEGVLMPKPGSVKPFGGIRHYPSSLRRCCAVERDSVLAPGLCTALRVGDRRAQSQPAHLSVGDQRHQCGRCYKISRCLRQPGL